MKDDIRGKMKPCPFCGRKVEDGTYIEKYGFIGYYVSELTVTCVCGATITIEAGDVVKMDQLPLKIEEDAVDKWNRRAEKKWARKYRWKRKTHI